jgi:hypothetical protein
MRLQRTDLRERRWKTGKYKESLLLVQTGLEAVLVTLRFPGLREEG